MMGTYVVYIPGTNPQAWSEGTHPCWAWDLPTLTCHPSACTWMVPGTYREINVKREDQ
jgi:hypothetical protein